MLYAYFYHMGIAFTMKGEMLPDTAVYIKDYVDAVKKTFSMTTEDIVKYSTRDKGEFYWSCMDNAKIATGPYVPFLTLQQYLVMLEDEEEQT